MAAAMAVVVTAVALTYLSVRRYAAAARVSAKSEGRREKTPFIASRQ